MEVKHTVHDCSSHIYNPFFFFFPEFHDNKLIYHSNYQVHLTNFTIGGIKWFWQSMTTKPVLSTLPPHLQSYWTSVSVMRNLDSPSIILNIQGVDTHRYSKTKNWSKQYCINGLQIKLPDKSKKLFLTRNQGLKH